MQRATLSARPSALSSSMVSPLSSSARRSSSSIASSRPAAMPLSTFTTRAAVGASLARHQRASRAALRVSASASDDQSSTSSSSSSLSAASSSSSSSSAAAAAPLASQPLALAAVGIFGPASTVPFGSALFASIGGGGSGSGGGWWKGGGGGGGNGGDGNNGSGGGGGGGDKLNNPSVSDLAAAKDDESEEEGEFEDEEEEEEEDASKPSGKEEDEEGEEEEEDDDKAARKQKKKRGGGKGASSSSSSSSSAAPAAFFVSKVVAKGLPEGRGVPTEEELFGEGGLIPGFPASRAAVADELRRLIGTGMFASVDARVTQAPGRPQGECVVEFVFEEKKTAPLRSFKVVSPSSKSGPAIPFSEVQKVMQLVGGETGMRRLAVMRDVVDGWYERHGYAPQCRVARFDGTSARLFFFLRSLFSLSLSLSLTHTHIHTFFTHTHKKLRNATNSQGLDSGDVVAVVEEPRVNRFRVVPVDDFWQPFSKSRGERMRLSGGEESANLGVALPPGIVAREFPYFKRGEPLNMGVDGRKAMRDVMALGLYDNCQVQLKEVVAPGSSSSPLEEGGAGGGEQDDELEGGGGGGKGGRAGGGAKRLGPQLVDVEVLVHERPHKTAELDLEWQLAPSGEGGKGKPALVTPLPGGSLLFEDRNLFSKGITASASLSSANLLAPSPEELGFRVDFKHPFVLGRDDPNRTALAFAAFNSRKLSPVFAAVPGSGEEVPPVMLERLGGKLSWSESYSRNSRGSLGLVVERVAAVDENGALAPRGTKQLATGALAPAGPPTTLSDTGRDFVAYLQGSLVRDATWDCAGQTIGPRDSAVVDQGLGVGSGSPIFNRATLSVTRHIRLPAALLGGRLPLQLPEAVAPRPSLAGPRPPASLVLHARGGAAVGALPAYEAFVLGGPHSVRGFNVGELSTARRFAEAAVELRVPVARATAFAFLEGATDLGSGPEVTGNPTAFYRRPGAGTSAGFGANMGAARLEYATDSNAGRGTLFMRYGERF